MAEGALMNQLQFNLSFVNDYIFLAELKRIKCFGLISLHSIQSLNSPKYWWTMKCIQKTIGSLQLYINLGKWLFTRYQRTSIHYSFTKNATKESALWSSGFFQPNPTQLQHLMYSFKSFVRDFSVVILILLNIGLKSLLTLCKMINLLISQHRRQSAANVCQWRVFIHSCWVLGNLLLRVDLFYTDNDI